MYSLIYLCVIYILITLIKFQGHREQILATAETRERRQRKLEHFFREAYAITFGLAPGERRRRSENGDPEVLEIHNNDLCH